MPASTKTSPKSSGTRRNPPGPRTKVHPRKGKGGRPKGAIGLEKRMERARKRKEAKREGRHLRRNYGRLRSVALGLFTRQEVEDLAKECGFYHRAPREIRAFEFVLCTALASMVEGKRSFASVWRLLVAAAGVEVARSAVTQRFGEGSAKLMETLVERVSERLSKAVCPEILDRLGEFQSILAHDGSVVKISALLQKLFPARRTSSMDAAIRVHGTVDVMRWQLVRVVLTGDRGSELLVARKMPIKQGELYLFDLGYQCYSYFFDIENAGGDLVSRLKSNANPKIVEIREGFRAHKKIAKERWGLNDDRIPDYFLKKSDTFDLDAEFKVEGVSKIFRVVGIYDEKIDAYHMFVTTLKPEEYSPKEIGQIYRLRWIIELLFKLLKSSCHLDHVDTSNVDALRTHIYSSILAAMILYEVCNASAESAGIHPIELSYLVAGIASPLIVIPLLFLWLERELSPRELCDFIFRLLTVGCRNQNRNRTRKHYDISEGW